jgi:hypothetical protein
LSATQWRAVASSFGQEREDALRHPRRRRFVVPGQPRVLEQMTDAIVDVDLGGNTRLPCGCLECADLIDVDQGVVLGVVDLDGNLGPCFQGLRSTR